MPIVFDQMVCNAICTLRPKENRMPIAFDQLVCNASRILRPKGNHNLESQSDDNTIRDLQHIEKAGYTAL